MSKLEGTSKAPESVIATSANDKPTPAKESVFGSRDLSRGDKGNDVSALQTLLGVEPTGNFNEATEKRVNYLQRIKGLKEDGKVTAEFRKLFKL